jgi:hypothetical protein
VLATPTPGRAGSGDPGIGLRHRQMGSHIQRESPLDHCQCRGLRSYIWLHLLPELSEAQRTFTHITRSAIADAGIPHLHVWLARLCCFFWTGAHDLVLAGKAQRTRRRSSHRSFCVLAQLGWILGLRRFDQLPDGANGIRRSVVALLPHCHGPSLCGGRPLPARAAWGTLTTVVAGGCWLWWSCLELSLQKLPCFRNKLS